MHLCDKKVSLLQIYMSREIRLSRVRADLHRYSYCILGMPSPHDDYLPIYNLLYNYTSTSTMTTSTTTTTFPPVLIKPCRVFQSPETLCQFQQQCIDINIQQILVSSNICRYKVRKRFWPDFYTGKTTK